MIGEEEPSGAAEITAEVLLQVSGETHAMFDVGNFVPHVDFSGLPKLELDDSDWATLERALNRPLPAELREHTIFALMYFAYSIALNDEIKTPRQYQNDMEERVDAIIAMAEDLLQMIIPAAPPPGAINQGSRTDKLKILKPGLRTNSKSAVLDVNDHVRFWLFAKDSNLSSTMDSLTQTLRALLKLKAKIADARAQEVSAGNPEQTELKILFRSLLEIASKAGDSLDLPAHNIRDAAMRGVTPRHPAYDFVETVTALLLERVQDLLVQSVPSPTARRRALTLFYSLLDKGSGKHIDFLVEARAHLEGGPRPRKPIR